MKIRCLLLSCLLLLVCVPLFAQQAPQYDILIRGGRVVDGSGNPWFSGDIGIVRDRIAFIGHADPKVAAKRTIDASGLIVAPGFIDMLGQSEMNLLVDKQAVSKLTQGITSEITGEGDSVAPVNDLIRNEMRDWFEHYKITPDWLTLDEYFERLTKQGSAINIGTYVGAATVRRMVIGNDDRAPTPEELAAMQEEVDDAMSEGALGLSTALIYAPGNYASTDELIALAKRAAANGGIYATHMRNEGTTETQALEEVYRIAREASIPVEIFHLKVSGRPNWGKMPQVVSSIEQARASGLDITADQYPYIASATSLGAVVPPKYHSGGVDAFVARLRDPAVRAEIRKELLGDGTKFENMWSGVGGPQGILISSVLNPQFKKYEGKTVAQIAEIEKKEPLDALMDLVAADHDNTGAVYFSMSEDDVKVAMKQPWVSVGTDYGEVAPTGPLSESKSHPRAYGSFARILGKYVRDEKLLRLEEAIRKFTSLPAQRVHLKNRGLLRPEYFADITIFDPAKIGDVATFEDPNRPSVGIEYVLVNGTVALEHGKPTGQFAGVPLRGPGYAGRAAEGLPQPGRLQGVVTDPEGWTLGRTQVTLLSSTGEQLGTVQTRYDGKYELPLEKPCEKCTLKAERMGFKPQQRAVDYNGTNSLWFSFAMKRTAAAQ
jgi:N-acyl-D-amino-acid deacylase